MTRHIDPAASLRNIYFGIVMGASGMIPKAIHIWLSIRALIEVRLLSTRPSPDSMNARKG